MTASVLSPVAPIRPVVAVASDAPLSVSVAQFLDEIDSGVVAVDVRSQHRRAADGVLSGALAIDAADLLNRLTPGLPGALRTADTGARWLLVSDDGHEAEWLTWHLQARGVHGARFVRGGFRALHRAGIRGRVAPGELAMISAH
ncbi:rhodanese-like domain-containing protein [Gordonia soli]|uniref:Rhodanese domain-containing protein n=1 Tax=Gordonia soli NBRC 108243 TaxID=1223545 RepID=M0QHT4_9ACTN|nr:rhodanese-like domain-containing protein [Gordonia soli]GAC68118.1 hypothetical protein GS4_11_03900 [Gordonia soli NBRC 108243]